MAANPTSDERKLEIRFHGRVIEHLGIDMYHSAVAAIAELVSNAWDAEATEVNVTLPSSLGDVAEIIIADDGDGMTFVECQDHFLQVGYNRRAVPDSEKTRTGRSVMGRKGIGKFAGFGIAGTMVITTTSRETGEKTTFKLDVTKLLTSSTGAYVDSSPMEVEVVEHLGPDGKRREEHGTVVKLGQLTLSQTPSESVFARSMGRRFLLLERAAGFKVTVNGKPHKDDADKALIEFDFPNDYGPDSRPAGLTISDGWGAEMIDGHPVRWRLVFYKDTIGDEDLAGVAIFSHGKLAQKPFYFLLSGGLGGQQGLPYLSGSVEADFIDEQTNDLISTERQRINWEAAAARPLLDWGQERVKSLLRIWQQKRSEAKVDAMEARLAGFSARLEKLPNHERKIVKRALTAIARISILSNDDFDTLADAMLQAWEGGRLQDLISDMAEADTMDAESLLDLLVQNGVLTALHAAERVKAQLNLVLSLEDRIKNQDLENAVRDFIASNPWLVSPEWETFKIETGVNHLIRQAADESAVSADDDWKARVDLCLASGRHLLLLEFMRPGLTADWDHITRFERYVTVLREKVDANSGKFDDVTGILIADRMERRTGMTSKLKSLRSDGMDAMDWASLFESARAQWQEYFEILRERAPEDDRMHALAEASRSLIGGKTKKKVPGNKAAKKSVGKKSVGKKSVGKKSVGKKSVGKKSVGKKAPAKKAP